jgi:hypothetical protein
MPLNIPYGEGTFVVAITVGVMAADHSAREHELESRLNMRAAFIQSGIAGTMRRSYLGAQQQLSRSRERGRASRPEPKDADAVVVTCLTKS